MHRSRLLLTIINGSVFVREVEVCGQVLDAPGGFEPMTLELDSPCPNRAILPS